MGELHGNNGAEGLSGNGGEERRKGGFALLDKGRNIATNGTEGIRPCRSAETARNLLLEFEHPPLASVVRLTLPKWSPCRYASVVVVVPPMVTAVR